MAKTVVIVIAFFVATSSISAEEKSPKTGRNLGYFLGFGSGFFYLQEYELGVQYLTQELLTLALTAYGAYWVYDTATAPDKCGMDSWCFDFTELNYLWSVPLLLLGAVPYLIFRIVEIDLITRMTKPKP